MAQLYNRCNVVDVEKNIDDIQGGPIGMQQV